MKTKNKKWQSNQEDVEIFRKQKSKASSKWLLLGVEYASVILLDSEIYSSQVGYNCEQFVWMLWREFWGFLSYKIMFSLFRLPSLIFIWITHPRIELGCGNLFLWKNK